MIIMPAKKSIKKKPRKLNNPSKEQIIRQITENSRQEFGEKTGLLWKELEKEIHELIEKKATLNYILRTVRFNAGRIANFQGWGKNKTEAFRMFAAGSLKKEIKKIKIVEKRPETQSKAVQIEKLKSLALPYKGKQIVTREIVRRCLNCSKKTAEKILKEKRIKKTLLRYDPNDKENIGVFGKLGLRPIFGYGKGPRIIAYYELEEVLKKLFR